MGFKTDHTNTQKSLKKKKVSWRNSGIYINIKQVNSTVSHNMKNWEVGGGGIFWKTTILQTHKVGISHTQDHVVLIL